MVDCRVPKPFEKKFQRCFVCSKPIDTTTDHYVQLSTYNRSHSPDDHAFFHFSCWTEYFNQRVINKMKVQINAMQNRAMQIFNNPMIKGLLSQVQGSEQALKMLEKPLLSSDDDRIILVSKSEVKKKIQNDRRKKRVSNKRKASLHKV